MDVELSRHEKVAGKKRLYAEPKPANGRTPPARGDWGGYSRVVYLKGYRPILTFVEGNLFRTRRKKSTQLDYRHTDKKRKSENLSKEGE